LPTNKSRGGKRRVSLNLREVGLLGIGI